MATCFPLPLAHQPLHPASGGCNGRADGYLHRDILDAALQTAPVRVEDCEQLQGLSLLRTNAFARRARPGCAWPRAILAGDNACGRCLVYERLHAPSQVFFPVKHGRECYLVYTEAESPQVWMPVGRDTHLQLRDSPLVHPKAREPCCRRRTAEAGAQHDVCLMLTQQRKAGQRSCGEARVSSCCERACEQVFMYIVVYRHRPPSCCELVAHHTRGNHLSGGTTFHSCSRY